MDKVFCFGELLLRMSPEIKGGWMHRVMMPVYLGGAELNVASALAKWEIPVKYGTALPDHYLSREIIEALQVKNIDTSAIHLSGNRIGIYFMPRGSDLKSAEVIYDRAHSSFASLKPGTLNWDELLKDCSWFHWTAISPALNENIAAVCKEALEAARAKGLKISVDLNYRSKLWQYHKQPPEVMAALVKYCDVVMGNVWAAENLLNIPSSIKESAGKTKDELIAAAGASMKQIHIAYPGVQSIAYTFRLQQTYFALLQLGAQMVVSKEFSLGEVVDKAGSGDCFMGGLIYGLSNNHRLQDIVDFAAAAAVGKMKETGDATHQNIDAVMRTVNTSRTNNKA
jgi:2-dehydro-3-deoxygluconokinase